MPLLLQANFTAIVVAATAVLTLLGGVVLVARCFRRCPSNRLLVVSGLGIPGGLHVQHGGARLVWPLLQQADWLSLETLNISIAADAIMNREGVNMAIEGEVSVAVGISPELMRAAAARLLGLESAQWSALAAEEAQAALRELISEMRTEAVLADRARISEEFKGLLAARLEAFGMQPLSVRLGRIRDSAGMAEAKEREVAARVEAQAQLERAELQRRQAEEALWQARMQAARDAQAQSLRPAPDALKDDPGEALKRM
ncbi:hypothetical protein EDM80_00690 [bacterium]|nr:MAG: hypothetical protein EDM80_00690 [bacterium]RIK64977.1 MAG: hypothetical protein DCC64_02585 [Planctomycetota bacterium]